MSVPDRRLYNVTSVLISGPIPGHRSEIRAPTGVQGNEGDKLDFRVCPDENWLLGRYDNFVITLIQSLSCFYNKKVKSFLQNVYWKEEVLIRACLFFTR
jgi:hypothetical protein